MEKIRTLFGKLSAFMASEKFMKFLFWAVLIFVIAIGIFIRIELYSKNFSFWLDECSLGANILNKSYKKLFSALDYGQTAPPFFMVVSKFLLNISGQINNIETRDLILRIIPLVSGLIALPLFAVFVHKIFKNEYITVISTAILALNIPVINYCQEFKQYETELFFSVILIFAFYSLNYSKTSPQKLFGYAALFSLAPWCAYSSLIILPVGMITVFINIFRNKCFSKLKALIFFVPLITSTILFYLIHYKKVYKVHHGYMEEYWMNSLPSFFTLDTFFEMFEAKLSSLMSFGIKPEYLIALLVIALVIFIYKNNKKIAFIILAPIILTIILSFAHKYPFEQRLILFLLPLFAIIFAQIGHIFKENKITKISIFATLILITSSQIKLSDKDIHISASREQAHTIANEAQKEDLIYAYTNVSKYYTFNNHNNIINEEFTRDYNKVEEKIQECPKNKIIWLYIPHISFYIPEGELEQFIKSKNYKLLKSERKPGTLYIKFKK